jgi:hypothetical protein
MKTESTATPTYSMALRGIVLITGMYTVAWGAFFRWFGNALTSWLAMTPGDAVPIDTTWFGNLGLTTGVLIFLSGFYPINWKWLTFAGIIGKIASALWFYIEFVDVIGWNKRTGFHLIFNELLWLVPLVIAFYTAVKVENYLNANTDEQDNH